MATQSSILALEITWTEEPGGLWSMGSQNTQKQLNIVGVIMLRQKIKL